LRIYNDSTGDSQMSDAHVGSDGLKNFDLFFISKKRVRTSYVRT